MAQEWIDWDGGECPVSNDDSVVVRFSDGTVLAHMDAGSLDWADRGNGAIVAYRRTFAGEAK